MPKKAQDAAHGKKNQRQGNPWVETVHADLDGWVQARTRLSLWRNTEGRFPCLPSGLAWGWWYGSFPAMSSQVGIPLPASRGVPTSLDVVSHILHHRKSLSPPSPSPAPGSLPKFPSPPSPPPPSSCPPTPPLLRGRTERGDNGTTKGRGPPTLRATEDQEGVPGTPPPTPVGLCLPLVVGGFLSHSPGCSYPER